MFDKLIDKLADKVSQKVVEHLEDNPTTNIINNQFDGGLVGDPELQAKRVLDVLEKSMKRKEEEDEE